MTDHEHESNDPDQRGGDAVEPSPGEPGPGLTGPTSSLRADLDGELDEHGFYRLEDRYEPRYEPVAPVTAAQVEHTSARRRVDPLALAVGLAALWSAGFFLLVSEPSLRDQGNGLWPPLLIITGVTLVLATTLQRR